jgi:thiol-disulfide isomerase/thioredoxin
MRRTEKAIRAAAITLAAILAVAAAHAADPASAKPALTWAVNSALELTVSEPAPKTGTVPPSSGEVFDRSDYQAILLLPETGDLAYVLDLKKHEVVAYAKAAVLAPDGEPHPLTSEAGHPVAQFAPEPGGRVRFTEGARGFLLEPAPPLLGPVARADLEKRQPVFARRAKTYKPDPAMVAKLASVQQPAEILAFFGTWCLICQRELPALFAALDAAANPNLKLALVAVDEDVTEPRDLITQYRVTTTPTMIVLIDGEELGRLEEEAEGTVEAELANILVGKR